MLDDIGGGIRDLWDRVRWARYDYDQQPEAVRLMFAGLPGGGKKTLFNALWGSPVLNTEPPPGGQIDLGLFRIVNLPCAVADSDIYPYALDEDGLIVYLINGQCGLQPEDFQWIARLRTGRAALLVVLNLITGSYEHRATQVAELETQLGLRVLPLNVSLQEQARGVFIDAVLRACPELGVPLAAQISSLRKVTAQRLIRQSVVLSLAVSVEPLPLLDITMLLGIHLHLLHRLSMLYGKRLARQGEGNWETVFTVVFGVLLRYIVQTALKFIPYAGWLLSGIVGASATWLIGQAALLHYEEIFSALTSPLQLLSQLGAKVHVRLTNFRIPPMWTKRASARSTRHDD